MRRSSTPARRWGDLFPLPPQPCIDRPEKPPASERAARRRWMRARRLDEAVEESVLALNQLAGFCDASDYPAVPENESQRSTLRRIRATHAQRLWPEQSTVDPRASLCQTLRRSVSSYTSEEGAGALAPYEPGHVSLPSDQSAGVDILDAVDVDTREKLLDFQAHLLKSPEDIASLLDSTEAFGSSYHDPSFEDPETWARFVQELCDSGMIHFSDTVKVINGIFSLVRSVPLGSPGSYA